MSEDEITKSKINFLELIKWLLPVTLSFIGWYVSQVIAPMDTRITEISSTIKDVPSDIRELKTQRQDCFRRTTNAEQKLNELEIKFIRHEARALTRREIMQMINRLKQGLEK